MQEALFLFSFFYLQDLCDPLNKKLQETVLQFPLMPLPDLSLDDVPYSGD